MLRPSFWDDFLGPEEFLFEYGVWHGVADVRGGGHGNECARGRRLDVLRYSLGVHVLLHHIARAGARHQRMGAVVCVSKVCLMSAWRLLSKLL